VKTRAFTLVEVLVSTVIISLMVTILVSITHQTSVTWKRGNEKAEQFRQARVAFDQMTRRLGQATLNAHWDYQYAPDDTKKERPPVAYVRQSRLRFRAGPMETLAPGGKGFRPTHGVFFQAPLGQVDDDAYDNLDRLLCNTGYFLEVNDDREGLPAFLRETVPSRVRSRLYELRQPAEKLGIYQLELGKPDDRWIQDPLAGQNRPVCVLAENILALVVQPSLAQAEEAAREQAGKKPLAPKFEYDSTLTSNYQPPLSPPDPEINPRHQLPPVVRVYMFAVDEESAQRLEETSAGSADLGLETRSLFKDAARLTGDSQENDLAAFERQLLDRRLHYRLFSSSVSLRGAKWSRSQTL
jgi:uncharacterized protein (TIGR02599 family)